MGFEAKTAELLKGRQL